MLSGRDNYQHGYAKSTSPTPKKQTLVVSYVYENAIHF